jgi:predicted Zn-dependent peptidase
MELYLAVTPEQIRDVANRYLIPTNRSVLDVLPGEPPSDGGPADAAQESEGRP